MHHFMPASFGRAALRRILSPAAAAVLAAATPAVAQESSSSLFAPAQSGAAQPPAATGTAQGQAAAGKNGVEYHGSGEHVVTHGRHSLPPGYQEAPNVEFQHGPDPDHEANIARDPVTGADLSRFGSAYQGSSPVQEGSLGDTNGNGWVAPTANSTR